MGFVKEFGDRRFYAAIRLDLHPGQAFGPVNGNEVNQPVQFPAGNSGIAFYVDGFYNAAVGNNVVEYFKVRAGNRFYHVDQGHVETQVRFVAAVLVHGFVPGHALHGGLYLHAQSAFEHVGDEAFHHVHYVVHFHKGHFHVQLCEFRLAVRPQVFVPEATGNLEVPFIATYHQQLFENLGGLGQRVKLAGVHTAGHQIVPGPFRSALAQHGSLNFQEAVVVHVVPHQLGYFMT